MDTNETVIAAAVGAVVASGVTLIVNKLQKAKDAKAEQAALNDAQRSAYERGYFEGRESILQNSMQNVSPRDFSDH